VYKNITPLHIWPTDGTNLPHDAFIYRPCARNLPGEDKMKSARRTMLAQAGKKKSG
jgi:hypothetical protein